MTGTDKPQLDHDGDRKAGGAKKPPAFEWIVSRSRGLEKVSSADTAARLRGGARMATARDFAVAGLARLP